MSGDTGSSTMSGAMRRLSHASIAVKLVGAFAVVIFIMGVIGVLNYQSVSGMQKDAASVDRANVILRKLDLLEADTNAAVAAERAYIIGNDTKQIDTMNTSADEAKQDLADARSTAEVVQVQQDLDTVKTALEAKLAFVHEAVDAYKSGGLPAAQQLLRDNKAAALSKTLADNENKVIRSERKVLAERMKSTNDATNSTKTTILFGTGIALFLAVGAAWLLSRRISKPVGEVKDVADAMAHRDLTHRLDVRTGDEIEEMAGSLNTAVAGLADALGIIANDSETLAAASQQLSAASAQMGSNAEETSSQSNVVSAASEEVSRSVESVATAVEQMTASIREIAQNASEAAGVAAEATQKAATTNENVTKLGDASADIGNVVKVITSIAEQTNLLALNATIEAARAGESGKGFAVVANEVKELANETARATEEISHKIEAVQVDTDEAVTSIREITEVIAKINDIQNTIASAVEEQAATTNEIGRNVAEAAKGTSEIAENITGVAAAAASTAEGVTSTHQAATSLSDMAQQLNALVGEFRY